MGQSTLSSLLDVNLDGRTLRELIVTAHQEASFEKEDEVAAELKALLDHSDC